MTHSQVLSVWVGSAGENRPFFFLAGPASLQHLTKLLASGTMALQEGEHPIVIPRPHGARPGGPPPWIGFEPPATIEAIARSLAAYSPAPSDPSIDTGEMREAAVLIPLIESGSGPEILVIKRPGHMPSHRGEFAFPGGGRSPDDEDLWATALREAREEIGLIENCVEFVARLDTMATVGSQFVLTPYVGVVDPSAELFASSDEADRVLRVPVSMLFAPGVFSEEIWPWPTGGERPICFFYLDEEDIIWGATGRILNRMLTIAVGADG